MSKVIRKYKLNCDDGQRDQIPCKKCCLETNHKIVANYVEDGTEDFGDFSIDWCKKNQLIQCLGCEEISYRVLSSNSEECDYDYETNDRTYSETATYYPARVLGSKIIDHWMLPAGISQIYKEARTAVESELFIVGGDIDPGSA